MLVEALRQFFVKRGIEPCSLLVAVSGGPDSTALLHALVPLRAEGFALHAAHVNHHLRGLESYGDEVFVRELCEQLEVELDVEDGTLPPRGNVEAEARRVRYEKLHAIRARVGADWIVTAHQRNDQAETVVMRYLGGASIGGYRGIHEIRDDGVIRPMLGVTRGEVEEYLAIHGITARHDRSNDDPRFLRNRLRARLTNDQDVASFADIAEQSTLMWASIQEMVDRAERGATVLENETEFRDWPQWTDPVRRWLLLRHIRRLDPGSRVVSSKALRRLAQTTRRTSVTRELELLPRRDGAFVLRRRPQPTPPFEYPLAPGQPLHLAEIGRIIAIGRDGAGQPFQLPPEAPPHFTVRNRRDGDRFQPLGMRNSKKLKDFLIDRKIARELRDRLPLLVWNGEIVWVGGVAVSERFKVTGPAENRYVVSLEGAGASERDQTGLHR